MNTPRTVSGSVILVATTRAVAALALAHGPSSSIAALLGREPDGDLLLWEPGGVWLLDVVRRWGRHHDGLPMRLVLATFVALLLGSLPLATLVGSRAPDGVSSWWGLRRDARRSFARLTSIAVFDVVLRVTCVVFCGAFVGFAARPFVRVAVELRPFVFGAFLGGALALLVGVITELARARVVWCDDGLMAALDHAVRWFGRDTRTILAAALMRWFFVAAGSLLCGGLVLAAAPSSPSLAWLGAFTLGLAHVVVRSLFFARLATSHVDLRMRILVSDDASPRVAPNPEPDDSSA
ncbi:MAG: hypothetical protein FJ096_20815 [Deltaproteobacteria bacterium]|nr:hypothetical protein [Deltaproteobacteria bacterium]